LPRSPAISSISATGNSSGSLCSPGSSVRPGLLTPGKPTTTRSRKAGALQLELNPLFGLGAYSFRRGTGGIWFQVGSGLFIALLNPTIAFVLAAAFAALWLYLRQRYLAFMAAGYCLSAIGFILQSFTLPFGFLLTRSLSGAIFAM